MSNPNDLNTILVAVDFTESSDLAFDRALELCARNPAASLHVVTVVPAAQSVATAGVAGVDAGAAVGVWRASEQAADYLRDYVERKTRAFREQNASRPIQSLERIVAHVRFDAPAEEVAQLAADLEADLVVVGTHGRRGVSRLVLGSVAEGTVRLAPCPVLVVRPKTTPAPVPAIEPPCPRCVETRRATAGREFWCDQHRERHGQRHTYHQGDRVGAETNMPLVVRT